MLKGKTAVITGSTSGIGLGVARAMAGGVQAEDRFGVERFHPLTTVSVGAVVDARYGAEAIARLGVEDFFAGDVEEGDGGFGFGVWLFQC